MDFEYPEDCVFFEQLLCDQDNTLETFTDLFDFRDPHEKRREFSAIRNLRLAELIDSFDRSCMLKL